MIAVKCSTPNIPRFEIVKVASDMSCTDRPFVRAFSASDLRLERDLAQALVVARP
jgi:hypothetical protein